MQHVKIEPVAVPTGFVQRLKAAIRGWFKAHGDEQACSTCRARLGETDGCKECHDAEWAMRVM